MKTPTPKPPADREVTIAAPNLWTSKGKFLRGQKVTLTAAEIAKLGDAVK